MKKPTIFFFLNIAQFTLLLLSPLFLLAQPPTTCAALEGVFEYDLDDQRGLWFCQGDRYLWILVDKDRAEFSGEEPTPEEKAAAFDALNISTGTVTCEGNRGTIHQELTKNPALAGTSFQFDYETEGKMTTAWIIQEDGSRGVTYPSHLVADLKASGKEGCERMRGFWSYDLPDQEGVFVASDDHFAWIVVNKEFWADPPDLSTVEEKARAFDNIIAATGTYTCEDGNRFEWNRQHAKDYRAEGALFSTESEFEGDVQTYFGWDADGERTEWGKAARMGSKKAAGFAVPKRTMELKHQRTFFQLTAVLTSGINYAKAKGQTPEEYGSYLGKLYTVGWNAEAGFEGYVNGMLGNFEEFRRPGDSVMEIIRQSENSIQFKWSTAAWEQFFGGTEIFDVSLDDLLTCFDHIAREIAAHMGCTHRQEYEDGWLMVTVDRK
jgi:hypothetical protein